MVTRKILVVEDDLYFAELIQHVLELRGLTHDIFVRVEQTSRGLSFMNADGKTSIADLSSYWLGLVDSRLKGCVMQGKELTTALTAQGLSVIAMSGLDSLNKEMVAAGAIQGIRKDVLWVELLRGQLDLVRLVTQSSAKG